MQQCALSLLSQEMEALMFDGPLQEMMKQAQKVAEQMKEAQPRCLTKRSRENQAQISDSDFKWSRRL